MKRLTILASVLAWTLSLPALAGAETELLNPNLASQAELEALPGIDADIAQVIIAGRPYLSASDLDAALDGSLGAGAREALYAKLFRPINLNNASVGINNSMIMIITNY